MPEIQQTQAADTPVRETGEGGKDAKVEATPSLEPQSSDAGMQEELVVLNRAMGRSFVSLDEAKKHYENLNKLVGDNTIAEQRKAAERYQKLVSQIATENKWSQEVAMQYLEELQSQKVNTSNESPSVSFDPERAELDAKVQRLEREMFIAKTPQAERVISKLDDFVKLTGKSYPDAYGELYKDVLQDTEAIRQEEAARLEKQGATVSASQTTIPAPVRNLYEENMERYRKTGKQEFIREAIKAKWEMNDSLARNVAK